MSFLSKIFRRGGGYGPGAMAEAQDPLKSGLSFSVDYVGFENMGKEPTEVFKDSEVVIQRLLDTVHPPYRRLSLIISDTHLVVLQAPKGANRELQMISNIPIYRVFYCGSHSAIEHANSVCIVAYSRESKGMKCLVFLCNSVKKAQALVNVVAKAFQNAYMHWLEESKKIKKAKRVAAKEAAKRDQDGTAAAAGASDDEDAAPTPQALAPRIEVEDVSAKDKVLADLGSLDISDTADLESERKEMHKTFSKRAKLTRPDVLDTGKLDVKPTDVDITSAQSFSDPMQSEGASQGDGESQGDGAGQAES
ncbi:low density lipoprotein receptor adapter protein 1-like [Sycon ciliatum]|uniref:low density lipoprotein receptor adapter protein 1-like n=1 Tax=Sycon ciliatum TaxID=27933 RepID=UPI0031F68524